MASNDIDVVMMPGLIKSGFAKIIVYELEHLSEVGIRGRGFVLLENLHRNMQRVDGALVCL